jgi:hypothetical protein
MCHLRYKVTAVITLLVRVTHYCHKAVARHFQNSEPLKEP